MSAAAERCNCASRLAGRVDGDVHLEGCAKFAAGGTHTPGPWEAKPEEVSRPYIRIRATLLGSRFKIANVLTPTWIDGYQPSDKIVRLEQDETRANARLIAASPDLLVYAQCEEARTRGEDIAETVLRCHGWSLEKGPSHAFMDAMRRAAIAKATGSAA